MTKATGDFDPADERQLARLVRAALFRLDLTDISVSQRSEVVAAARAGAIDTALVYSATTAKTTKWKNAANAANYQARLKIERLGLEILEITGPGDLTSLVSGRYEDDGSDHYRYEDESPRALSQAYLERDAISQLSRLPEPDATVVKSLEAPVAEVAERTGLTPEAVRQRRKRLRARIQDVIDGKLGAAPPDPDAFVPRQPGDDDPGNPAALPRTFSPD